LEAKFSESEIIFESRQNDGRQLEELTNPVPKNKKNDFFSILHKKDVMFLDSLGTFP
jgi:hypothetical protein